MIILVILVILVLIIIIYLVYNRSRSRKITIIYINLDKSLDRKKHMINQASKHDLKITRFPAVYGKTVSKDIISKIPVENLNLLAYYTQPGHLGCYLSHCNLYKYIVKNKIANSLILEDDIVFVDNFKTKLKNTTKQLPKDWDILLLGKSFLNNRLNTEYSKDLLVVKDDFYGTYGYLINYNTAKKLIKDLCNYSYMVRSIDEKLWELFSKNYKIYATREDLITPSTDSKITETNIKI